MGRQSSVQPVEAHQMTTLLAIIVAVSVIGQLALILWLRSRDSHDIVKRKVARLVEDAADRQVVTYNTNTAKVGDQVKGLGGE